MTSKLIHILTIIFVLAVFANICFAQDSEYSEMESNTFPWESQSDYAYFEEASHFWNLNFRPGTGNVSLNCFEYLEYESTASFLAYEDDDEAYILMPYDVNVKDYWTGASFGGVVYKYIFFKVEAGLAHKSEILYNLDVDGNRTEDKPVHLSSDWDMTYMAEMRFGVPINKDFTLVGMTSFRVWNTEINSYKTYKETDEFGSTEEMIVDIDTEIFVFRAQVQLFFEVYTSENYSSLNVFAGFGYHSYQAQQLKYDVRYFPKKTRDADVLLGATWILDNKWMLELKVIPAGVFTAYLQFSYIV